MTISYIEEARRKKMQLLAEKIKFTCEGRTIALFCPVTGTVTVIKEHVEITSENN